MAYEFTNYAGVKTGVDEALKKELIDAGIEVFDIGFFKNGKNEVDTSIRGSFGPWSFERAWVYWRAKGPGIPPDYAVSFNNEWGDEVRVEGYAGGTSILYNKGFGIGSYHIDTPAGLKAFTELLKRIMVESDIKYKDKEILK